MSKRRWLNGERGFALIDVLCALIITSLVVGSLSSISATLATSAERAGRAAGEINQAVGLQQSLQMILGDIGPLVPGAPPEQGLLVGSEMQVSAFGRGPPALGISYPTMVSMTLRPSGEGKRFDLVVSWTTPDNGHAEFRSVGGVKNPAFSYLSAADRSTWNAYWVGPSLPGLVKLTYQTESGGDPLSAVVAPRADIGVFCALTFDERCRDAK